MAFLSIAAVFVFLLCAVSAAPRPGRIVSGIDTSTNEHLHQVTLQMKSRKRWRHICGGSIIADQWVVTASHCVDGTNRKKLRVVVHKDVEGLIYYLDKVVMHPGYSDITIDNDIALLKTQEPIADANVYMIDLPPTDDPFIGENCTITGWGYVEYANDRGTTTEILQETLGHILDNQGCLQYWPDDYDHIQHLCIHNEGSAACMGDSGGPMVCKQYLAGVTSFGNSDCLFHEPEVYTRVSNYVGWINDTMAALS